MVLEGGPRECGLSSRSTTSDSLVLTVFSSDDHDDSNFFLVPSICVVITTVDGALPWDTRFVC